MCYGCQNSGGVWSRSHQIRIRVMQSCFEIDKCYSC
jgi:hypothetical protein